MEGESHLGSSQDPRELLKLGVRVSQSTIQKYQPRDKTPRGQSWMTFLRNHLKSVVAVDFFTVPTVTFRVLYVFIILHHERRRVLHFNITEPEERSDTVTTVLVSDPEKLMQLRKFCNEKCGVVIGRGIGDLQGKAFRIAHMGHVNAPMLLGTLE